MEFVLILINIGLVIYCISCKIAMGTMALYLKKNCKLPTNEEVKACSNEYIKSLFKKS